MKADEKREMLMGVIRQSVGGLSKWPAFGLPSRCQIDQNPNQFWRLIGDILGVDLVHMDYEVRLQTLLMHRIGLWDVVAEARREGSLDSNIRDHSGNDLMGLIDSLPKLTVIAFNGGTAERIGMKALAQQGNRHHIVKLPSSSPAHTLPYSRKLRAWQDLRAYLSERG